MRTGFSLNNACMINFNTYTTGKGDKILTIRNKIIFSFRFTTLNINIVECDVVYPDRSSLTFRGSSVSHHQGRTVSRTSNGLLNLHTETVHSSRTSVTFYQNTWGSHSERHCSPNYSAICFLMKL
jgi:hypothetical protein